MAKTNLTFPWQDKLINPAQLGGIETSVLDNGLGRNTRIAWINTGSPLRYKVVIDRGLDIADAFYHQHSLAWLSHAGVSAPRPDANQGLEWLYPFFGGLLTTCGLSHVGSPESDQNESRGLHGRFSNLPAQIESIIQPDPINGNLDMSITAVVRESKVFGPNLELRRTISGTLGQPQIHIKDVVTNCGCTDVPHMILYHFNFGWPLVDDGADLLWNGSCTSRGLDMDDALFNKRHNYRKCLKPLDQHRAGESCGFIDVTPDKKGLCAVGIHNPHLGLALALTYKKSQLPCLTNWQRWAPGEYVTALEPGTNPPLGQKPARDAGKLIFLKPAKSKSYELTLALLDDPGQIEVFLKKIGQ